jgi:hypothetical protein
MNCSYKDCTTQVSDSSGLCIRHTQLRTYVGGQLVQPRSYAPPVKRPTLRQQQATQFASLLEGSPTLRETSNSIARYLGVEGKTDGERYGKLLKTLSKRSDGQPYLDRITQAIEADSRKGAKDVAALQLLKRLKK